LDQGVIGDITVDHPDPAKTIEVVPDGHLDPDPDDWPWDWWDDFCRMKLENIRLGHIPGEAARLAYEVLKARAATPWRSVVSTWPIERRQVWGDLAGRLQDAGANWRDAERQAFEATKSPEDALVLPPRPDPSRPLIGPRPTPWNTLV
jgi:hypothetical protein